MRKFSSEGSLLDLDFRHWQKVQLKNPDYGNIQEPRTYTQIDRGVAGSIPIIQEPQAAPSKTTRHELSKELSVSAENLSDLGKLDKNRLEVSAISEGCRAYSDSQLAPATQIRTESLEPHHKAPLYSSASSDPFRSHRHQHRARLAAAKVALKSLFGQSPHLSNSNLSNPEHQDSPPERRSRLHLMSHKSQMGHSKKRKISRDELEKWAESLNSLLASQTGVFVFGAFLRSEFSEENLQFYLACEEYRNSSTTFSLHRRAKDISSMYIQPGAPHEVNLDSRTRDQTLQLLQNPSPRDLLHAQKRIFSLLDSDCYPRFLQSSIYLTLLQEAE